MNEFKKYIAQNFRTPIASEFKGGKLIVSFIVAVDGSLTDFKCEKDLGFNTFNEAKRVLSNCPKWQPATQNGIPVRCLYTLPITLSSSN